MRDDESLAMPADPSVEQAVLGACFMRELAYHELVADGLKAEHFHMDSNRRIWRAMEALAAASTAIDHIAVLNELEKRRESEKVGGIGYVMGLLDGVPDYGGELLRSQLKKYAEILHDKFTRRRVIELSNNAIKCSLDSGDEIKFTVAGLNDDLLRMQGSTSREGYEIKEFSSIVLAEIREEMKSDRLIVGLPFGVVKELDEVTTGMRSGEVIVVGGYPASGKTAFALDVARRTAMQDVPVAMFSLEMTKEQVVPRLWSQHSDISYRALRNPHDLMTSDFRELEQRWVAEVDKLPLTIDDDAKHIAEIIPRAHLYVRRKKVKLIVIDFLQIVDAPGEKEYERVSNAMDAITAFAKKSGVPIICLSQLSRPEDRKNAANVIPNMAMLRASGKIEQNAHVVLFTFRPEDDNGNPTEEDLLIIGKQRAGVKRRIKAVFDGRVQRWEPRGTRTEDPQEALDLDGSKAAKAKAKGKKKTKTTPLLADEQAEIVASAPPEDES